jgi:hypothetical protein
VTSLVSSEVTCSVCESQTAWYTLVPFLAPYCTQGLGTTVHYKQARSIHHVIKASYWPLTGTLLQIQEIQLTIDRKYSWLQTGQEILKIHEIQLTIALLKQVTAHLRPHYLRFRKCLRFRKYSWLETGNTVDYTVQEIQLTRDRKYSWL